MLLLGHALVGGEGQQAAAGGGRVHPLQPRVALDLLQGGSLLRVPLQHPGDETDRGERGDAAARKPQTQQLYPPFPRDNPWGQGSHPRGQRVGAGWRGERCLLCALCRDMRGDGVATVHDHGEGLAVVGLLEGGVATHQHVEDDPQAPDVCKKQQQIEPAMAQARASTPGTPGGRPTSAEPAESSACWDAPTFCPMDRGTTAPPRWGRTFPIPTSKQVSRGFTKIVEVLSPFPGQP